MVDRIESELIRKEQLSRRRQQQTPARERQALKQQRAANDADKREQSRLPRTRDAG
ncbi:MAG: hypothetical protein NXH85_15590 [Pseudomonadaceae bacterium]|nr:hypothetical protein [Pseudomonadaceae bacterium]